jgi:ketosteroid isomerase-like protein
MSAEEANKELAARFLQLFSQGPAAAALAMTTDDFEYWVPGNIPLSGRHNKTTVAQLLEGMAGAFKTPLEIEVLAYTAQDDRVAVEARSKATTATGKPFRNTYHFLFRFRDGKIAELREYMDTAHVVEAFS